MMSSTHPTPSKDAPVPAHQTPGADPAPQGGEGPDAARERLDRQLDEALEETFPASDPIALSPAR
jgi:hypothetical protein